MTELIFYSEASDEMWVLPGMSDAGLQALERISVIEKKKGFVSDFVLALLRDRYPVEEDALARAMLDLLAAGGFVLERTQVLLSSQVAEVEKIIIEHVGRAEAEQSEAIRRGQAQARACLGTFGKLLSDDVDATTFALGAIAKWLSGYAQIVQPSEVAWASRVKPREHPAEGPQRLANKLEAAVEALYRAHPEWPVQKGGVVRLNPRSEQRVTCVGVYVHFEGHAKQAIVWPTEVR